jgi:hypothetical protein
LSLRFSALLAGSVLSKVLSCALSLWLDRHQLRNEEGFLSGISVFIFRPDG